MNRVKRQSGFTLIELLIVVVILGIIAAIVIPQFGSAAEDAKLGSLKTNLSTIRAQVEFYKFQHNGNYPSQANFAAQMTAPTDINGGTTANDFGPYLIDIPTNPFNLLATIGTLGSLGDNSEGWAYDGTTGEFRADSPAHVTD